MVEYIKIFTLFLLLSLFAQSIVKNVHWKVPWPLESVTHYHFSGFA